MLKKILTCIAVILFIASQMFVGYELSRMEKERRTQEIKALQTQIQIKKVIDAAKALEMENMRLKIETEYWRDQYLKKTIRSM